MKLSALTEGVRFALVQKLSSLIQMLQLSQNIRLINDSSFRFQTL